MWKEGTIGIPQKDGGYKAVHYWIKVYEKAASSVSTAEKSAS